MKLFLLFSLLSFNLFGQKYEWASGTKNLYANFRYSTIDYQNNLIIGGSNEGFYERSYDEIRGIIQSDGKIKEIEFAGEIIASYSPTGSINWVKEISNDNDLFGISHQDSLIVLLVFIGELDTDEKGFPIGHLEEFTQEEKIRVGLNLFYLDLQGNYIRHHSIFKLGHSDFENIGFKSHPDGGYIISAFVENGIVCTEFSQKAGNGGADMIMKLNEQGLPDWMRLVSNESNTCCRFFSRSPLIEITKDGTILLASTYHYGAIFDDDIKIQPKNLREKGGWSRASYIASYSSQGELNWVCNAEEDILIESIAANEKEILVGVNYRKGNKAFGVKLDTNNTYNLAIITLNRNGKVKDGSSISHVEIYDIVATDNGNFFLAGEFPKKSNGVFDSDFTISNQRKDTWKIIHSSNLRYSNQDESPEIIFDMNNEILVVGSIFYGKSFNLSKIDSDFHSANAQGDAAVITKIKK